MKKVYLDQAKGIVAARLEPLLGEPNVEATRGRIGAVLGDLMRSMEAAGEVLMLADGMRAVAARAVMLDEPDRLGLQWRSDFFPTARYGGQSGDCMPLGFHGDFDLYIGFQPPLPPTLIARYGDLPHQCQTSPAFLGGALEDGAGCLSAAVARARQVGVPPNGGDERDAAFFTGRRS